MLTELTHPRRTRARHWYAAAAIGLGALTVTTVTAPARSATGPAPAPARTAQNDATGSLLTTSALTGQSSHTVTLITGDKVTLTRTASGQTSVTPVPGSGPSTRIEDRSLSGPRGARHVYAFPSAAVDLIADHALDRSLFDVEYLADHGDDGAGAHIPVTVHFAGTTDAETLTARASALPGAAVGTVHAATGTVDVSVDAARAGAFWQALTGRDAQASAQVRSAYPIGRPASALTGAASAWTTGQQTAPVQPADDLPSYSVTVTATLTDSPASSCTGYLGTICPGFQDLVGVQNGSFVFYYPVSVTCVDLNPCHSLRTVYQVPPGTYEAEGSLIAFSPDDYLEDIDITRPEVRVASDTTVTVDADTARSLTPSTPTPTTPRTASVTETRQFPGMFRIASGWSGAYGSFENLVVPADAPTTGTYTLVDDYTMAQPPVSMSGTGKTPIALHPIYPFLGSNPWARDGSMRFPAGEHTYPVVDAGLGTDQDFAGVDARGKLALVREYFPNGCALSSSVIDAAAKAGVAGLIVDPDYSAIQTCWLPVLPSWRGQVPPAGAATPFVSIPVSEAASLRKLLSSGPVSLEVTDIGDDAPVYHLAFAHEGRIPTDLHDSVTDRQLMTSRATIADDTGAQFRYGYDDAFVTYRPNTNFAAGSDDSTKPGIVRDEYFGPVSPDTGWSRAMELDPASEDAPWPPKGPYQRQSAQAFAVRGGSTTSDWFAEPLTPGAVAESQALAQGQPDEIYAQFCSMCRTGDFLLPTIYLVNDADHEQFAGPYLIGPDAMHLYQGATEIPQTKRWGATGYALPPQKQRYRLDTTIGSVTTEWTFDSAAPTVDRTTSAARCLASALQLTTDPCAADPLVFLRYDAGLGAANVATAGGRHRLVVHAYHQDPNAPQVKSLTLEISTDGGTTWQNLSVRAQGGGDFTAGYTLPAGIVGTVSIKAHAVDAAGDEVTQTALDAFAVTSGR